MWKQRLTNSGAPAAADTSFSPLGAAVVPEVGPFWLITMFKRVTGNAVDMKNALVEPAAAAAVVVSRDAVKVVASVTNNRDSSQRLVSVPYFSLLSFHNGKSITFKGFIVSAFINPLTGVCSCWSTRAICCWIILTHHFICKGGECDEKQRTERNICSIW